MPSWLTFLLDPVSGLLGKIAEFIPNPEERQKAQLQIQSLLMQAYVTADQQQRDINKVEAASPSLFVAGWRPAVGWLCVFTLAWTWFVGPMFSWFLLVFGVHSVPALPTVNEAQANDLLYALLGIGAMRTADKLVPGGVTKQLGKLFGKDKS